MLSGMNSEGMPALSKVPKPRTVSTWSTFLISSSRSACWEEERFSVITMEKAPLWNSSSMAA